MSYKTDYTLFADSSHDAINASETATNNQSGYLRYLEYYPNGFEDSGPIWYGGEWSWYDHDDDMCMLSAEFPEVLFLLEGIGEEYPDFWKTSYKGGKIVTEQIGKVVFEDA